jgi:hypothetical protein
MTKYRRKTANAKERERMKMVNQAFDRLREVMPDLNLILDQEKETKVFRDQKSACSLSIVWKIVFSFSRVCKYYFSSL